MINTDPPCTCKWGPNDDCTVHGELIRWVRDHDAEQQREADNRYNALYGDNP